MNRLLDALLAKSLVADVVDGETTLDKYKDEEIPEDLKQSCNSLTRLDKLIYGR